MVGPLWYTEGANEGSREWNPLALLRRRMLGSPLARLTELSQ